MAGNNKVRVNRGRVSHNLSESASLLTNSSLPPVGCKTTSLTACQLLYAMLHGYQGDICLINLVVSSRQAISRLISSLVCHTWCCSAPSWCCPSLELSHRILPVSEIHAHHLPGIPITKWIVSDFIMLMPRLEVVGFRVGRVKWGLMDVSLMHV